ncbi:MAG: Clostripain family protein, partial [Bacteroidaceae bacterium]|nr:Clostripain family protein [Bacteroidaceae bacterium]
MVIILSSLCTACSDNEDKIEEPDKKKEPEEIENAQTLLMYMPWSNNLTGFFKINIADMEDAIADGVLENERVLVYLATSAKQASLFELVYNAADGTCERKMVKEYEYEEPVYTTTEGIASILNDMKTYAPATRYSMTIGGHGLGWVPVQETRVLLPNASTTPSSSPIYHWEAKGPHMTRYFGGTNSTYQTNVTTLAEAIEKAGIIMEYILFDVCYMSTIEVAYDLRHVTRHLIASTSEVMAYGMPYKNMAQYLLGDIDYEGISQAFYNYYINYSLPCGTIATTITAELDSLATLVREINTHHKWDASLYKTLQHFDGYTPHIFLDYGDYVSKLCTDSLLLNRFNTQLERVVPSAT